MFVRVSVKFRDREIKPLMFGPFVTASDDKELLQLNLITERVRSLVERVNKTSGLGESHSIYDRFRLDVEPREDADPQLPAIRIHQIMVEQYLFFLEENLFAYEPLLPPIDFGNPPTRWEKIKNWLSKLPERFSEHPSSYTIQ